MLPAFTFNSPVTGTRCLPLATSPLKGLGSCSVSVALEPLTIYPAEALFLGLGGGRRVPSLHASEVFHVTFRKHDLAGLSTSSSSRWRQRLHQWGCHRGLWFQQAPRWPGQSW